MSNIYEFFGLQKDDSIDDMKVGASESAAENTIQFELEDAVVGSSTTKPQETSQYTVLRNTGNGAILSTSRNIEGQKPSVNLEENKGPVKISTANILFAEVTDRTDGPISPSLSRITDEQYDDYVDLINGINDNLIPHDREASFANIVQATVVETSARSVGDPSIGSK